MRISGGICSLGLLVICACAQAGDDFDRKLQVDAFVLVDGDLLFDAAPVDAQIDASIDAPPPIDSPVDAPPAPMTKVYAHTETQLYEIDPTTLVSTWIGPMNTSVYDIALRSDGTLFGCGQDAVFEINTVSGAATTIGSISEPCNGAAFVPVPGSPGSERFVVVGYVGQSKEVSTSPFRVTELGNYGDDLSSSGDLMYLDGTGILAAVYSQNLSSSALAFVNPLSMSASVVGSGVTQTGLWGVAAWDDEAYAFTSTGEILQFNIGAGTASIARSTNIQWWGAASNRVAP